jgi:hypothetical protein
MKTLYIEDEADHKSSSTDIVEPNGIEGRSTIDFKDSL